MEGWLALTSGLRRSITAHKFPSHFFSRTVKSASSMVIPNDSRLHGLAWLGLILVNDNSCMILPL